MRETPTHSDAAQGAVATLRDATFRRWFSARTALLQPAEQWWAKPNTRAAFGALLVAGAYYLSAHINLSITFESSSVSPVWPPNAILLVALLLAPMETWWVYLLVVFGAHMLAELTNDVPLAAATGLYFTNAGEAVLGAYLVRRLSDGAPWLGTLRKVEVYLICAVVAAPVITSFGDAAIMTLIPWGGNSAGYWQNWQTRCVSDILTQLTVGPALLLAVTGARGWMRGASRWRWAEAALLSATLLLVGVVALGGQITPRGWTPTLVFAVLPVLFWAAVRFGIGGTTAALLGITIVATWNAAHGRGLFSAATPTDIVISLQLFLICIAIPMLILAAVIDDRQHALEELQTSEARYRDLVESQTEMVCRYLPDSTLTYVNEAFCRIHRKSREQLIGMRFFDVMDQRARDHHVQYTAQFLTTAAPAAVDEHEVELPDGSIGWQQWVDHPIYDAEGHLLEIQAVGRDITERKRAEEALRESEARFRAAFESAAVGMALVGLDGHPLQVNHTLAQMLGYSEEEMQAHTFAEFTFPEDIEPNVTLFRQAVAGDIEHYHVEKRYLHKEGRLVWGHLSAGVVRDAASKSLYLVAHLQDITERKRAEEAVQASEARYRAVVETQTEMITRYRPDTTLTFVNDAACRFDGKSREELLGTSLLADMPEDEAARVREMIEALLAQPDPGIVTIEHQTRAADGSLRWQQWVHRTILDSAGQVIELQGIGRDITERKRAEEALRASEVRYREVVRNLPQTVVLLFDAKLRHTFADGPGLRALGLTPDGLEGRTLWDAFPEHLAAALAPHYEAALTGRAEEMDVEYAHQIHRTQVVPMPTPPETMLDGTGAPAERPVGMVVLRDITEQRRARDELVRERTRAATLSALSQEFQTLAEHSPDLIARFDLVGRFVYLNQAVVDRLGRPAAYWVGKTFAELGVLQSMFEPWAQVLRDVVQTGMRRTFDIVAPVSDGQVRSLHVRFIPEFADDGCTLLSVLGIATDVSALKHAEARLAEQASELEAIFEAKADGMAVFDLQGRFVRANSALRDLLGFDADSEYTSLPLEERAQRLQLYDERGPLLSPEQWPQWRVLRGEVLTGAGAMEGRVRTLDGREPWISVTGAPVRAPDGQIAGVVLITRDVTARRALERQATEQAVEQAAVAERNRLAHELHDTVTQEIYSAGLLAESVTRNWPEHRAAAEEALAQLPGVIRGALAGLRILLLELRPTTLEQMPLAVLLRQLGEAMCTRAGAPIAVHLSGHTGSAGASEGVEGAVDVGAVRYVEDADGVGSSMSGVGGVDGAEPPLPAAVKVFFYRVAQEALMNAAKYAHAGAITVRLRTRSSGTIDLAIADDGQGFDPSAVPAGHLGLAIMRERAQEVGATVQVRSRSGQGTKIIAVWRSGREQLGAALHQKEAPRE